jgi:hypothetical protein
MINETTKNRNEALKKLGLESAWIKLTIQEQPERDNFGLAYLPDGSKVSVRGGGEHRGEEIEVIIDSIWESDQVHSIGARTPDFKKYDYKALVQTYVESIRKDHLHEDFNAYFRALLKVLESIFEVEVAFDDLSGWMRGVWMLFNATINSYLSIRTPWSGFLEVGRIPETLEQAGNEGKLVLQLGDEIESLSRQSSKAHLEMLYNLFIVMFGERDKVVTSKDLMALGFDDSDEPNRSDYWQYE